MVAQLLAAATALVLAASAAGVARADVVPTAPGPGEVFTVGSACNIEWDLDTTGEWTNFSITLMTGSNLAMVPVQTVATGLDGTTGAGTIDYDCPNVTPDAAIYFYQFAQTGAATAWTTRFTIAAADGSTTEPTETTAGIEWGTGSLVSSSGSASSAAASSAAGAASSVASSAAAAGASSSSASAASSSSSAAAADESSSSSSTTDELVTSTVLSTATASSSSASSASSSASGPARSSSSSSSSSSASASASAQAASAANLDSAAGRVGASVAVTLLGAAAAFAMV